MGLFDSFFNAPPAAPNLQTYTPPSFNDALGQYLGQQTQLPGLQAFATAQNQGANTAFQNMLFGTSPTLKSNMAQFGQNTQSLLNGQLPADVQAQVENSAAYSSMMGGYGGSNMAHALTARDLGQTSLSLQQQGASQLGQQTQMAAALNPSNVMPSSMFYSPSTILSSDQQAALINNQIGNQNQMIDYQNQLQADKGSPFEQMLTNNMASMLGMATNPMTAMSAVMSAENGNYNPAMANSANTFAGIPSSGPSMGTQAVDPNTGMGYGNPTPGSGAGMAGGTGGGGSGGGMGGMSGMMGMASMCCFIFMEAYDGKMPWWVRECRDEFAPESTARRIGYVKMARWLVPAMRQSRLVRAFVNMTMIQPLTKWGGWYKGVPGYQKCRKFHPVVRLWFSLWELMGRQEGT